MKRLEKARKKAESICDNADVTDQEKAQQLKRYVVVVVVDVVVDVVVVVVDDVFVVVCLFVAFFLNLLFVSISPR